MAKSGRTEGTADPEVCAGVLEPPLVARKGDALHIALFVGQTAIGRGGARNLHRDPDTGLGPLKAIYAKELTRNRAG